MQSKAALFQYEAVCPRRLSRQAAGRTPKPKGRLRVSIARRGSGVGTVHQASMAFKILVDAIQADIDAQKK